MTGCSSNVFFLPFSFLYFYLLALNGAKRARARTTTVFVPTTYLYTVPTIPCSMHTQSYTRCFIRILAYSQWHCVRHVCPILHSILPCITVELTTVAISTLRVFCPESGRSLPVDLTLSDLLSMLLPRELHVLHLNTFPLLCNLFSLASLPPHSTPCSSPPYCYIPLGQSHLWPFLPPPGRHSVLFMSGLFLFWQRSKVPKHESYLPPLQPLAKLYAYQDERSWYVYAHTLGIYSLDKA